MSWSRRLALLALLLTSCGLPDRASYSVDRDVRYAGAAGAEDPRVGDLYRPVGDGPWPAVLVVHGGSWRSGARWEMARFARRYAHAGYVVFNIDYRLAPEYRFPAQLDDVRAAFGWLHANAGPFSIDPNRIAVMGYSAGAHLALLLGLAEPADGLRPRAVVAGAPPTDLTEYPDSPVLAELIGGSGGQLPERYREASPVSHVSADDPPVLLYHGTLDFTVSIEQSRRLFAKLRGAGVAAELREEPWEDHSMAFLFDEDAFRAALAFLADQMPPARADRPAERVSGVVAAPLDRDPAL